MADLLSKSAKKRAAKKARDEAGPPEAEAPAPVPEPKAKAKAKAKEATPVPAPEPKAKAKAKSEPKAAPKAKSEPKAAPKAEAKPEPKATAKAEAKPKAKAKSDGKKKQPEPVVQEVEEKKSNDLVNWVMDDGKGDDWGVAPGGSKRQQKKKAAAAEVSGYDAAARQNIPGAGPASKSAAGMMSAKGVSQAVGAGTKSAKELIQEAAAGAGGAAGETKVETGPKSSAVIHCPEEKVGRVIGPKGANLILIKEKTGVSSIDTEGGVFTVVGPPDCVQVAEVALRELVEKGFMSLAYENFSEVQVLAHPSTFPDLIGSGGCVIIALKKAFGVEINIPAVPKTASTGNKKYPVGIAGDKAASEKAKEAIESIIYYYHHPATHPDLDHIELEIDYWNYSFIIGTKGSEMRHIQKTFDVKVYIPRDHSANQNVVVVGLKKDCERVKTYIEKLIAKGNEPRGRGAPEKASTDDREPEDEPWMQQYMYKRK